VKIDFNFVVEKDDIKISLTEDETKELFYRLKNLLGKQDFVYSPSISSPFLYPTQVLCNTLTQAPASTPFIVNRVDGYSYTESEEKRI